ncbi:MAG: XdhC/CoxI family protein [Kordiimonadales bacterium]|nr:MAG: XdhC/CoxI family protein [Kordiimonadales bacterium]
MQSELEFAVTWLKDKKNIVIAVVASTWGSAPRPVGSMMVINSEGHFEGSVSGGCVEGSIVAEATALLSSPGHKVLTFAVGNDDAWQVGLACGGTIEIHLYSLSPDAFPAIEAALHAHKTRQTGALTVSNGGESVTFTATTTTTSDPAATGTITHEFGAECMVLPIAPNLKLVIIGAVHIAQALAPMATVCGFDVTVVDPRELFLGERVFGDAERIHDWPDEYLAAHPLDASSALVTLTHDPKIDEAALKAGLKSDCFYIGALGSKKTQQSRIDRLSPYFTQEQLGRIHGPVGLSIGAKSPAEIAVSIMAELTETRRHRDAL